MTLKSCLDLPKSHNEESGFLAKPRWASFQAITFVVVSLVKGATIPFKTRLESDRLKVRRNNIYLLGLPSKMLYSIINFCQHCLFVFA